MHFRVAAGRIDALAVAMPAKIEEQDIVAATIFESCHRAQGRAGDAVSMTDNHGWSRLRLRPELAVQEFSIAGMEEERALERRGRLRAWFGHFPGELRAIHNQVRSGKFFYKEAGQHNQAGGCCDAQYTPTGCQAHYPAAFIQIRLLLYALEMFSN